MKRLLWVVLGLVYSLSCKTEVRELSENKYDALISEVREKVNLDARKGLGIDTIIPIDADKGFRFKITWTKPCGGTLPDMALHPHRLKRILMNRTRTICREKGVRFEDFSTAHSGYGRLGLSYQEEVDELVSLLNDLKPDVRKFLKGEGLPLTKPKDWRNYDQWHHALVDELSPQLDSTVLERSTWLAYDLGLATNGLELVIHLDENGDIYVDDHELTIEAQDSLFSKVPQYGRIYILPYPELETEILFTVKDSLRKFSEAWIVLGNQLSLPLMLSRRNQHFYPAQDNIDRMALIEVLGNDEIRINHEQILDITEVDLDSVLQSAFQASRGRQLVISAHDSSTCGEFIRVGNAARRITYDVYFLRHGPLPETTPKA